MKGQDDMGEVPEVNENEVVPAQPVVQTEDPTVPDKGSQQTAGVTVMQWLTYAFWGWLILALIWMLALVLTNIIVGSSSGVTEMLPYSIAAILVLLPVAAVLDFFYRRHEPAKKTGAAAVIMVIHAVIFALLGIGALIAAIFVVVFSVINGTLGDGQKVAVGMLFGAVALYAMALVRTLHLPKPKNISLVYSGAMIGVTILLLILGGVGPLATSIRTRDDRRIETSLPEVHRSIGAYMHEHKRLPASLSDVSYDSTEAKAIVDDALVEYKNDGERTGVDAYGANQREYRYQLCVTYIAANNENGASSRSDTESEYQEYLSTIYSHPSGRVCYKLMVSVPITADGSDMSKLRMLIADPEQ